MILYTGRMQSIEDKVSRGRKIVENPSALKRIEACWDDFIEAEPFRTSRLLLGIYGGLPFTWKKPHLPSRDLANSTFAVSVIIVSVLGLLEYHLVVSCYQKMWADKIQLKDVIILLEVVLYSFFYFIYFAMWLDVPIAGQTITTWRQLGKTFYRITGRHLKLRRRSLEKKLNVALVIFPVPSVLLASWANPQIKFELTYYPVLVFSGTCSLLVASLWIGNFESLRRLAKEINTYLQKDLENYSLTSRKLQDYREMWLMMRSFSVYASSMHAPIVVFVICVILIIFLIYEMIVLFENGDILSAIAHTNLWVCSAYFVHYMANASANAVQEIKKLYTTILARESLYFLTPDKQREIIGLYLVERTGSPIPSYGGFVILKRSQALSVFGAISAYLVLLMQFSQKVNEIESKI